MKALWALYFILSIGFAANAADAPQSTQTARARCDRYLAAIGRAVPAPEDLGPTRRRVQKTVAEMQAVIKADENAQKAGGKFAKTQDSSSSPIKEMGDGLGLQYHSGGEGNGEGHPSFEQYRQLKERLAAIAQLLESGAQQDVHGNPVSLFEIEDPDQIKDLLQTSNRIGERGSKEQKDALEAQKEALLEQQEREKHEARELQDREHTRRQNQAEVRETVCLVGGTLGGAVTGVIKAVIEDPNKKLEREIVAEAKKTTVTTLEQHIAMVKLALRDRADKDAVIKAHLEDLALIEKAGFKLNFGIRFSDYEKVDKSTYNVLEAYENLARKKRPAVTVETLKKEYPSWGLSSMLYSGMVFTPSELGRRYHSSQHPGEAATRGLEAVFRSAGVAGVAGYLACGRAGGGSFRWPDLISDRDRLNRGR